MMKVYPRGQLGSFENEWLDTRYHFSFSNYYNPTRMGFGPLRVINDDKVRAGSGFDPHPHRDMEIITYVRTGSVIHRDSLGHEGRTGAGDVQVMSAGTGITHAEYADPEEDTTLFQIWIRPDKTGLAPRWEQAQFPKTPVNDHLPLLVSGRAEDEGQNVLKIHQDAAIYGGVLVPGAIVTHALKGRTGAYVIVSAGQVEVNGTALSQGDGAEITDESSLRIRAPQDAEILVIEV